MISSHKIDVQGELKVEDRATCAYNCFALPTTHKAKKDPRSSQVALSHYLWERAESSVDDLILSRPLLRRNRAIIDSVTTNHSPRLLTMLEEWQKKVIYP